MMRAVAIVAGCVVAVSAHKEKKYYAPTKSCPKGYSLEGKQCVSRSYHDEDLYCANGALSGNSCVSYSALSSSCEDGWALNGKICTRTTSAPSLPHCYNGFALEGDYCVSWTQVELVPTCYEGTLVGNSCLVEDQEAADLVCPAEYSKGECYTSEQYECTPSKKGYGRWLGKKWLRTTPSYGKKAHYKAPPTTWCTRRTPVDLVETCSSGWELSNGVCLRSSYHDAALVCPLGNASKGGCSQRETVAPDYQCPAGYTDSGKSGCFITETASAEYYCAYGEQEGDRCASYSDALSRCSAGTSTGKGTCLILSTTEPTINYGKKY